MMAQCPVCGGQAFQNKRGVLLIHTTGEYGTPRNEVCRSYTKGAKP